MAPHAKSLLLVLPLLLPSCLPPDDRPPPGRLLVTASPSPSFTGGIDTVDGWHITFTRVFINIGRISLGRDCIEYAEARYNRIIDPSRAPAQKISESYGFGQCDVGFRLSPATLDSLLGIGVTEQDRIALDELGSDPYVADKGTTLRVEGSATQGSASKHFVFSFRNQFRYEECKLVTDAQTVTGVNLGSNSDITYDITIAPEWVFADDLKAESRVLRFAPFAKADDTGDANGEVTLEELRKVPVEELRPTGAYGEATPAIKTLGDFVYLQLFPLVPRYRDVGTCKLTQGGGHRD